MEENKQDDHYSEVNELLTLCDSCKQLYLCNISLLIGPNHDIWSLIGLDPTIWSLIGPNPDVWSLIGLDPDIWSLIGPNPDGWSLIGLDPDPSFGPKTYKFGPKTYQFVAKT